MLRTHLLVISLFLGLGRPALGEEVASIARGGLLYDHWPRVLQRDPPTDPHPAYPKEGAYRGKGSDYRCKECHGWDYRGKDGAYQTGKHKTGIKGIRSAAGRSVADIRKILADANHGFDKLLSPNDLRDVALFVAKGQIDMDVFIDRKSRRSSGSSTRGARYYTTVCAKCHEMDGKGDANMEELGPLSRKNPWEVLHKILNGQPDAEMPALRAFDLQVSLDILAYLQTLAD